MEVLHVVSSGDNGIKPSPIKLDAEVLKPLFDFVLIDGFLSPTFDNKDAVRLANGPVVFEDDCVFEPCGRMSDQHAFQKK